MNECINSKQKTVYLRSNDIYIYEMKRQERLTRLGTFAQIAKLKFGQTFRGKLSLFKIEVVKFSPIMSFFGIFPCGVYN